LGRDRLRQLISNSAAGSAPSTADDVDERMSGWTWVHDWRSKIRLSSRSRTRADGQNELEALVREKADIEGMTS
jgi:hypothetical protein